MMRDDENPPDLTPPAVVTNTPPAVKVTSAIAMPLVLVAVLGAITTALIVGKLGETAFVSLITFILGALAGRSKPEGVVGEATLMNLLNKR